MSPAGHGFVQVDRCAGVAGSLLRRDGEREGAGRPVGWRSGGFVLHSWVKFSFCVRPWIQQRIPSNTRRFAVMVTWDLEVSASLE